MLKVRLWGLSDSLGNPNTVRYKGIAVGKTAELLGEARPLASVEDTEIGKAPELLWGRSGVNTWNARRGHRARSPVSGVRPTALGGAAVAQALADEGAVEPVEDAAHLRHCGAHGVVLVVLQVLAVVGM